jgi:hypothetical protein
MSDKPKTATEAPPPPLDTPPGMPAGPISDKHYEHQPSDDTPPAEVAAALKILSGQSPLQFMTDADEEKAKNPLLPPVMDESAQDKFIRARDKVRKLEKFTPHIAVFDVSNIEDIKRYEEVMSRIGDPIQKVRLMEPEKTETFVDKDAPRGFRTIVTVRWAEYEFVIERQRDDYTVVSKENPLGEPYKPAAAKP